MDRSLFISLAGKARSLPKPITAREGGAPVSMNRAAGVAIAKPAGDTPEGVKKAARQFESFFISYLFKVMKQSVPDSPFSGGSSQAEMYEDMFGAELGNSLSKTGGLGLADYLEKNLARSVAPAEAAPGGRIAKKPKPVPVSPAAVEKAMRGVPRPPSRDLSAANPAESDHTAVHAAPPALPKLSEEVIRALDTAADTAGVDRNLVRAVAIAESGGNPKAESRSGARGLMQLMAATARELGVTKVFDPLENALAGARYLKRMLVRHGGDERLALASYNAGPGTVARHGGVPPFRETRAYIEKVLRFKNTLAAADAPRTSVEEGMPS